MIQPDQVPAPQKNKFLTGSAEQVPDHIMGGLDLAGIIAVDDFCKPCGSQVFPEQAVYFTPHGMVGVGGIFRCHGRLFPVDTGQTEKCPEAAARNDIPEHYFSLVQIRSVCQFQNHSGFMFMQVSS